VPAAAAGGAATAAGRAAADLPLEAAADKSTTERLQLARRLHLLSNQRGYSDQERKAMGLLLGQKLLEAVSPREIKRLLNRYRLAKYIMLEQVRLMSVTYQFFRSRASILFGCFCSDVAVHATHLCRQ
jgi:hypothetical protein